jgi:hypothetical protein
VEDSVVSGKVGNPYIFVLWFAANLDRSNHQGLEYKTVVSQSAGLSTL